MATYHIATREQLQAINDDLAGDYILDNDIDLNGFAWDPIGSDSTPFSGTFNGQNFHIRNLYLTEVNSHPVHWMSIYDVGNLGIFAVVNSCTIQNVILDNFSFYVNIDGGILLDSAPLVGSVSYPSTKKTVIYNCHVNNFSISVITSSVSRPREGAYDIAGIVGSAERLSMEECSASGSITVSGTSPSFYYISGIAGYCLEGEFIECHSRVALSASGSSVCHCGSDSLMIGMLETYGSYGDISSRISSCTSNGNITISNGNIEDTGGFAGSIVTDQLVEVNDCNYEGEITFTNSTGGFVGGFIGSGYGDYSTSSDLHFEKCYSHGRILFSNSPSSGDFGGFAGDSEICSYRDCYSSVDIEVNSTISNVHWVGGFIGYCEFDNYRTIVNCYSSGTIILSATDSINNNVEFIGGFIGTASFPNDGGNVVPLIENCYSSSAIIGATDFWGGFSGTFDSYDGIALNLIISNCSWYRGDISYAIGNFELSGDYQGPVYLFATDGYGTDEHDSTKFYIKNHAVYASGRPNPWGFHSRRGSDASWTERTSDYPTIPLYVHTPQELKGVNNSLSRHHILDNDINLAGFDWTPIGYILFDDSKYISGAPFTGTFDGQGYKIKNLTFVDIIPHGNYAGSAGLFGQVGDKNSPIIKDFTLENVNLTGNFGLGSVVSRMSSPYRLTGPNYYGGVAISNVHVNNAVLNIVDTADGSAESNGGFIGDIYGDSDFKVSCVDCSIDNVTINFNGSWCWACGGFAGNAEVDSSYVQLRDELEFSNCSSTNVSMNIVCSPPNDGSCDDIGGFAGYAEGRYRKCYSTGDINFFEYVSDDYGITEIGGFAGQCDTEDIKDCYTSVNINTNGAGCGEVGGFIGSLYSRYQNTIGIRNCYSEGMVTVHVIPSADDIGGFIGYSDSYDNTYYSVPPITNCFFAGTMNYTGEIPGGFIGYVDNGSDPGIANCAFYAGGNPPAIGTYLDGSRFRTLEELGLGTDEQDSKKFISRKHKVYLGEDVENNTGWINIVESADWSGRMYFGIAATDTNIHLMGGEETSLGPVKNDIWWSQSGGGWYQITNPPFTPPWSPRAHASTVYFNNYIYTMGGTNLTTTSYNDVWRFGVSYSSVPGWTEITPSSPWTGRHGAGLVVNNNRMFLIGGNINTSPGIFSYSNDVYSSDNGSSWTLETSSCPAAYRAWFGTAKFLDRIWVIGGGRWNGGWSFENDVWSSVDGRYWVSHGNAPCSPRLGHQSFVYDNKLWIVGGYTGSHSNEVWYTNDGSAWTRYNDAEWSPRSGHSVLVLHGRVFLLGGGDNDGAKNDIWVSWLGSA